jgi:AcrR family transcriptional regulator
MTDEPSTRDRLVTAATRLFRQRGYDGTGLTEILTEARRTSPALPQTGPRPRSSA